MKAIFCLSVEAGENYIKMRYWNRHLTFSGTCLNVDKWIDTGLKDTSIHILIKKSAVIISYWSVTVLALTGVELTLPMAAIPGLCWVLVALQCFGSC